MSLSRTSHDQRSHLELITVYEICRILGASLDTARTFHDALNVLAAHLGLDRAMIVMPVADEGRLGVHSSVGLSRLQEQRGAWKHGEGVIGHVFASAMPVVVPDVAQAPVTIERRAFVPSDLDDAWLVVAAATPEVNRQVADAAEARRIFVNAVDDPPNATAYLGGVVRREGVTLAISTSGEAPAIAGMLREGLDALLPQELGTWMDTARAARPGWRRDGIPMEQRRPLLLKALNRLYAAREGAAAARELVGVCVPVRSGAKEE